ncbi:MAG: MBL fold metallo-hydrolase [Eubacteriales bacterium]|nr:MBL fold metallo-hydrolase [Eubacteriales bacterium]
MTEVKKLVVGPLEENCYILKNEHRAVLVDPGAGGTRILNAIKSLCIKPEAILITHAHFDHIMAVAWVKKEYPEIPVYAYIKEKEVFEDPDKSLLRNIGGAHEIKDIIYLEDNEVIEPAGIKIKVIATPGHTVGSACYLLEGENVLLSGDTLFLESAGRTDFPTGSTRELTHSIREILMKLPDDTVVYPGHGDETTIRHERTHNFVMFT